MKARCLNPKHPRWEYYGGRGITIAPQWLTFETFLADMGVRPSGTTLDRINGAGNYEPGNCRWATRAQQAANRRPTGRRDPGSLMSRAREAGMPYMVVYLRVRNGWDIERALTEPVRPRWLRTDLERMGAEAKAERRSRGLDW